MLFHFKKENLILSILLFISFYDCNSAFSSGLYVDVNNESHRTRCAEEDNVSFSLISDNIDKFKIEAIQPRYVDLIKKDTTAPNFENCNFGGSKSNSEQMYNFKRRNNVVLYEDDDTKIVGVTMGTFWRPNVVPVTISGKIESGFQLIKFYRKHPENGDLVQVFVFYPSDGYWRAKPFTPLRLGNGVFGSSFLIGPVEQGARPTVNIASVEIIPQPLSVKLQFAVGGEAMIRAGEMSEKRTVLEITLTDDVDRAYPFALLRSMYVANDNADVSEVEWSKKEYAKPHVRPVLGVASFQADDVRFGRSVISKHNTSAPDMRFYGFESRE